VCNFQIKKDASGFKNLKRLFLCPARKASFEMTGLKLGSLKVGKKLSPD
jgi:hypothetical protein